MEKSLATKRLLVAPVFGALLIAGVAHAATGRTLCWNSSTGFPTTASCAHENITGNAWISGSGNGVLNSWINNGDTTEQNFGTEAWGIWNGSTACHAVSSGKTVTRSCSNTPQGVMMRLFFR